MIRWCSYCQSFLGERHPYDDPSFSHSICNPCTAGLDQGIPLVDATEEVRALVFRLLDAARSRDWNACQAALHEAESLGLANESILVALLQPALYQAGREWQDGRMSVAAEHLLTSWCEDVFAALPETPRPERPSVLLFPAPGEDHTLGARFAARLLAARGVNAEAFASAMPMKEIVALARRLRPSVIGFSCALPASVELAREFVASLRECLEPDLECRYLFGGIAFRVEAQVMTRDAVSGIEIIQDLEKLQVS